MSDFDADRAAYRYHAGHGTAAPHPNCPVCREQKRPTIGFIRVRLTRRVPTIHLGWHVPFDGEKRLTTLCGQTAYVVMDDSMERVCATCERMTSGGG